MTELELSVWSSGSGDVAESLMNPTQTSLNRQGRPQRTIIHNKQKWEQQLCPEKAFLKPSLNSKLCWANDQNLHGGWHRSGDGNVGSAACQGLLLANKAGSETNHHKRTPNEASMCLILQQIWSFSKGIFDFPSQNTQGRSRIAGLSRAFIFPLKDQRGLGSSSSYVN